MRLFVGIDLDQKAKQDIGNVIERLKNSGSDVKWTDPDNLHVTIKFLGEVHGDDVKEIEKRVSDTLKGVKKFTMSICEVGYFGRPGHMKVIWVGMKEGRENVTELSKNINKGLSHVRKEDHKFSPHITIGRVRSGRNSEKLMKEMDELRYVKLCEVDVNEIKLKQSVLREDGPVYSDFKTFTLG